MLRILVLSLLLYIPFSQATEEDHLVPLSADTQGPNIPPIGSSLFDKLYSKQMSDGTVKYNVPFPLDQLIASQDQTPETFVHSMFPFSRSLQRPVDLSYNPLLNPRIVFASKDEKKYFSDGKLFLGYVKARNQLEVISYNEEAGRFEYQIVTGYGSSHQNVYYVDRGKCLSCHQGQAPIFSAPSWEDSTFGAMKHLLYEQLNIYTGDDREKRAKVARILFGSIHSSEEIAQLDHLVRKANDISTDERIWIYGCGEDSKCRLGLLIKTLCPSAYDS
ncbi:MAG: hypothetical protein KDD34_04800, partial [Bdellovibrionales bacterium]|nr:hypothetical protein [Bdellovibrionales bacterium]